MWSSWILEIDRGKYFPYEGNYSTYLEKKAKRLEQEEREESGRQTAIRHELEWIRQGAKARQTKSKARIAKFDQLVAAQEKYVPGKAEILIQVPERLGGKVIEVNNISKAYGDKLLFEDLSFTLPPGGIVGVIGPNGAGKSTLFKLITGQEKPDSGEVDIGPTVHLGYVDQSRDHLDNSKNVWEEISDGLDYMKVNGHDQSTRAYVGAFNFKGQDQQKNVGKLSGGERNRVNIAKMLKRGRQRAAARRADQRSRRRDLGRTRRSDREFRRLRRGHQPRPLLPRSSRDAHPRVRRRQPRRMVRRQFRSL